MYASDRSSESKQRPKQDAFQRILRLASMREQASQKLRERLLREGYQEHEVEQALERAIECNIVNDSRYAECYLRSQRASGKGLNGMLRELDSLSIDYGSDDYFMDLVYDTQESEEERAMELLLRRPPHAKNAREAAYRRLVSKGFSSQVASSVARKWSEDLALR